MLSKFLTDIFQGLLKERSPTFAYWLFYTEMSLGFFIGVLFSFAWPFGTLVGLVFFLYAAFCWVGACNYARKRAAEKNMPWDPSRFDRLVAIFLSAGSVAIGALFAVIGFYINWFLVPVGIVIALFGVSNIINLVSGEWVTFP